MFDVEGARKAGYTDAEIAAHLAASREFDADGARKAGYSDSELIAYLSGAPLKGQSAADQIPGQDGPVPAQPRGQQQPKTVLEKLKAAAALTAQTVLNPVQSVKDATETALTVGTGLTAGAAGMVSGTVQGMVENAVAGQGGTPEAAANVERRAAQGAELLTYKPKSPAVQEAVETIGKGMQEVIPLGPLTGELASATRAAAGAAPAAEAAARAGGAAAGEGASQVAQAAAALRQQAVSMTSKATQKLLGASEEPEATGAMDSVGAAGTSPAAMRRATAQQLPVPMELTTGQATRNHQQLRFEGETAKGELGQPLRENAAKQNVQLAQNFEALIDSTGAQAPNVIEAGRAVVDNGLVPAAARLRAQYRAQYQAARRAGEMEQPVSTAPLVQFLQDNASLNQGNLAGGALGLLERELVRLGALDKQGAPKQAWTDFVGERMGQYMKSEGGHAGAMARISREWQEANGGGFPQQLSLNNMELLRRQMNNAIDAAPENATNMRAGAQIKELIDQATEGMGGDLYRDARRARQRYAQLFENNAVVRDLMRTRRGTADRQVALEDVFRRTILSGSRDDLSMLRRTLQIAGGEEGHQAWRELQGQTLRHLLDEATKGVGSDIAGNSIFSAAKLQQAIRALDVDQRLEFVLGKQRAQMVRDINEIAKVVTTVPPGALNTSNTASVILAAIAEAGATGGLTGLPVPVLSTIRLGTKYVRDRAIRQRVLAALGKAEPKKVKAPKSVVPKNTSPANQMPESRTVH